MKFNELFEELMGEAMQGEDQELYQKALDILLDLKKKMNPSTYAKLMARLNDLGSHMPSTKTIKVPSNPQDSSWVG